MMMMSESCVTQEHPTCPTQTIKAPYLLGLAAAGDVLLVDTFIKYVIFHEVPLGQSIPILQNVVSLTHVHNTGVAFSLLNSLPVCGLGVLAFALLGGLTTLLLAGKPNKSQALALGLMLGGGLNNALNRLGFGFVVDYIQLDFVNFAIFNLSDMAVCIGAVWLAWQTLQNTPRKTLTQGGNECH